jgi:hypothetical protein
LVPADVYKGFVIGASGDPLSVWSIFNPAAYPIYLLANTGGDNLPMSFGGVPLTFDETGFVTGKVVIGLLAIIGLLLLTLTAQLVFNFRRLYGR